MSLCRSVRSPINSRICSFSIILLIQHDKKSLSPYGMFPCSLPNDPPPLQKQAHIPFLIYQKLYFTAILHTHNTQLYFLSLLSDQFLFNAINLVCSIFITNE